MPTPIIPKAGKSCTPDQLPSLRRFYEQIRRLELADRLHDKVEAFGAALDHAEFVGYVYTSRAFRQLPPEVEQALADVHRCFTQLRDDVQPQRSRRGAAAPTAFARAARMPTPSRAAKPKARSVASRRVPASAAPSTKVPAAPTPVRAAPPAPPPAPIISVARATPSLPAAPTPIDAVPVAAITDEPPVHRLVPVRSWVRPLERAPTASPAEAPPPPVVPLAKAGSTVIVPSGAGALRRIGRLPGAH